MIIRKPAVLHSRYAFRKRLEAKKKGRHSGPGKRSGTANARTPEKMLWMRRQRVLRRVLRKYRDSGRIDKTLYRKLYLDAKGNAFKHKRALLEQISKSKAEAQRSKILSEQEEARRIKANEAREEREKKLRKKWGIAPGYELWNQ